MFWKLIAFVGCVSGLYACKHIYDGSNDTIVIVRDQTLSMDIVKRSRQRGDTVFLLSYCNVLKENLLHASVSKIQQFIYSRCFLNDCNAHDVAVVEYCEMKSKIIGIHIYNKVDDNITKLLEDNPDHYVVLEN